MPALPLTVLHHSPTINVGTFHAFGRSNMAYFYGEADAQAALQSAARQDRRLQCRRGTSWHAPSRLRTRSSRTGSTTRGSRRAGRRSSGSRTSDSTCCSSGGWRSARGWSTCCGPGRSVHRAMPNARLLVVGGGRRLAGYRAWVRARGWSEVHFIGHVSADDLVRYYQTSDVFCAPSTGQESFGIVLLEAMAAGPGDRRVAHPGLRRGGRGRCRGAAGRARAARRRWPPALIRVLGDAELRRAMGERGRLKAADVRLVTTSPSGCSTSMRRRSTRTWWIRLRGRIAWPVRSGA